MEIIDLLRKCFGVQQVAVLLGARKNLPSPVRTQFFADGGQYPFASISVAEMKSIITNIPVVRRGNTAYALDRGKDALTSIEPQGVDMSDFLSAAMINNLKMLSADGVQAYANQIMNYMMNTSQLTTEALCSQALTGAITYPMKADGGETGVYSIDYGTPNSLADKDLSSSTTIMDVYNVLDEMFQTLQSYGYGNSMTVAAGKDAFNLALTLADSSRSNILKVSVVNQGEINIGGYTVKLQSGMYRTGANTAESKIQANTFCAMDTTAGAQVKYLSLDDLANGLQPLPFATTQEVKNNPSGMEIIGRSKPLPIVPVSAICWAKVLPDTVSATLRNGQRSLAAADTQTSMKEKLNNMRVSFTPPVNDASAANGANTGQE